MKSNSFLILALSCIGTINLLAASTRIDAKTWRTVQKYDVRALSRNLKSHTRELVAAKFNFRGKDIHHLKSNWYESSIWQPDPQGKKGFSDIRVIIAKKDWPAFKPIRPHSAPSAEITLYGRGLGHSENTFTCARSPGRSAVRVPSATA